MVRLHDGEVATIKIVFVDAEYEDIIVDVLHTNRPQNYKGPSNSAYTIVAVDIVSVDEVSK